MENNYKTILFDFDGVLSNGRFYKEFLLPEYSEAYDWIQKNIFGNKDLVKSWMRNEINSKDVNKMISKNTGLEYELLNNLYRQSIYRMELSDDVMETAMSLRSKGVKIGIVTDNMDIFTEIIVPNHKLNYLFDVVVNSADYGILKNDVDGKLFDIALNLLGQELKDCLMIDDSESTVELLNNKGSRGFLYKNIAELKSFLQIE